jgi:biopolymer transport protein ExbD
MKGFVNIKGREKKKARIEIVPMIDAIFFLLVFFMYSSLSMVKMKGMGVSIPKLVKSNNPHTPPKPPRRYIVTLDSVGKLFVNLDPVSLDHLNAILQSDITSDPDGTIVVNVDRGQTVQSLVDIMDKVNTVTTPDGKPATVLVATSPVDARKDTADQP